MRERRGKERKKKSEEKKERRGEREREREEKRERKRRRERENTAMPTKCQKMSNRLVVNPSWHDFVYTRDLLSQPALYMMHATDAYSNDGDKIHQLANKEINSTSKFFCRSDQADRQIVWRMRMMTARHQ